LACGEPKVQLDAASFAERGEDIAHGQVFERSESELAENLIPQKGWVGWVGWVGVDMMVEIACHMGAQRMRADEPVFAAADEQANLRAATNGLVHRIVKLMLSLHRGAEDDWFAKVNGEANQIVDIKGMTKLTAIDVLIRRRDYLRMRLAQLLTRQNEPDAA
jgi:hypothetical protein